MKIATVLSVSALLATFSVVACSSPTTPADSGDQSDSADSKSDDSKDSKSSSSSTSSPSNTTSSSGSTTTGDTTTTPASGDASEAACDACLAEDPTMKKVLDCEAKCSDTDDACFTKCASDNGCAENNANSACEAQFNKCADKCEPSDAEIQACETCLSGQNNAQVNAIEKCYTDAKDEASAQKCDAMQCDATCESAYKACDSKCGF